MIGPDRRRPPAGHRGLAMIANNLRLLRPLAVLAVALALGGCFQPLYGSHPETGATATTQNALAGVDVVQIPATNGTAEARIAVETRNNLLFELSGGQQPSYPTHQLRIRLTSTRLQVIVDVTTARPDVENYGLNAYYDLVDMKTGKVVLKDQTFSRVSYDIPGQMQRFARERGLRDAENRAAKTIAESIRNRLASYFVAGT
jgi:LPS-assembly lipoprotein